MPLPDHYAVARVIFKSPQKDFAINVLWYELSIAPGSPAAEAAFLANAIDGVVGGVARACLTTSCAYHGVQVSLHTTGGVFVAFDDTNGGLGTSAGDELPSFCAAVIQKRTLVAGKEGRGRWYLPFIPEAFTDENQITGGNLATIQALADAYAISHAMTAGVAQSSHYSPKLDFLFPLTAVIATVVLGSQRRRRLRATF